jgi:uncharacterized membrane protein YuzA (DUF378 family)
MDKKRIFKSTDLVVWTLLTIGGLNWGLVGIFGFNLVAAILGEMTILSRIVYALVGLSAVYEVFGARGMIHRWNMHFGDAAPT